MMRRPRSLLPLAALAAACHGGPNPDDAAAKKPAGPPPALPVEVTAARRDTVQDVIPATGQIEAMQAIELRPDVEGRLVQIYAREGAEIARGTPLFKIDDVERQAEVQRAEADRDLAQQSLARTRELIAQNAASRADLERAEATARSTEAALALLRVRLDRSTVRAPFDGVVGRRLVSLGDYVTTATRLAELQTVTPQRAAFQVPERFADQLRVGQRVAFAVAALPGREFLGIVDFVDPQVRQPGRTITVKAQVPNPKRELTPGMFIEARLVTATRGDAVVIPEDAVLTAQGSAFVFRVVSGKAVRTAVTLGQRSPGEVEIATGLEAGQEIVVGGLERVSEGASLAPRPLVRDQPAGASLR